MALSAIPAAADVGGGRLIEVFTGSNLIGLHNYPPDTRVHVEVLRQGFVIGETTKTTDADGLIELNHVGGTDCFDGPTSPDVMPGDTVRASFAGISQPDTSLVRGVFINEPQFGVPNSASITLSGELTLTGPARVAPGADILELRINKDEPWDVNDRPGRRDKREEIVPADVNPDGSWTHVFTASAQDVSEARASSETFLEWSAGAAGEVEVEPPEITVAEPLGGGEAIDCPPLQEGPTPPQLARAQDSGNPGDHVTNQSVNLTFSGLAGPDAEASDVQPGANAEVRLLFGSGAPVADQVTADANGVYRFTGITLAPRVRPYSLMVRAKDPGQAPTFDSVVRRVTVDAARPAVVVRQFRPSPLHLAGPERLHMVYRVSEAARLDARIQRRLATGVRTVNTFRVRNLSRPGRVEYNWNGRNEIRRNVRPGRYQMMLTITDRAGNRTIQRNLFRVVR